MRSQIRSIVESIMPFDELEAEHQTRALEWIESGAGLFRVQKPATPTPHLVSYFVVIDCEAGKLLLVDHKNAGLWLPSGGHVEVDEHPRATVEREALEELGIEASFRFDDPLFITVTETVGQTVGHTDVSLWYVLVGDSSVSIQFDEAEFHRVRWFTPEALPYDRTDPHLRRFVRKLSATSDRQGQLGANWQSQIFCGEHEDDGQTCNPIRSTGGDDQAGISP